MKKNLLCCMIAFASFSAQAENDSDRNEGSNIRFIVITPADSLEELETDSSRSNFVDIRSLSTDPVFMAQQAAALHGYKGHRRQIAREDNTQAQRRRNNSMLQAHINECRALEQTIQLLENDLATFRAQQRRTSLRQYHELARKIEITLSDLSKARSRHDELIHIIIPRTLAADDSELAARTRELQSMR